MDNNASERAGRGPAVARKIFYGSGALWSVGSGDVFAVGHAGLLETQSAMVADVVLGELCGGRREGALPPSPPSSPERTRPWANPYADGFDGAVPSITCRGEYPTAGLLPRRGWAFNVKN